MPIDSSIYWRYLDAMPKTPKQQGLASLMGGYDTVTDRINEQRKLKMQKEQYAAQQEMDALKKRQIEQQMAQSDELQNRQNMARSIMQSNGVMQGNSFNDRAMQAAMYDPSTVKTLADINTALNPVPKDISYTYKAGDDGNIYGFPTNGGRPINTNVRAQKPQGTNITIDQGKIGEQALSAFTGKLPDGYAEAVSDQKAVDRYNGMLSLLDKHGDSITGLQGGFKRLISPVATYFGLNTEAMDDAQILKTLFDVGAGSLRSEVVGPGPVSNYEQSILQSVSGGRMSAAEGAKRLIKYNRDMKMNNVKTFNSRVQNASSIDGLNFLPTIYPEVKGTEVSFGVSQLSDEDLLNGF